MARREPSHRDEGSAQAVSARAGRFERLTISFDDTASTSAAPVHRTLAQLAALAAIRGDATARAVLVEAADVARSLVTSTAGLASVLGQPPAGISEAVLRRLRDMEDAGGWVLIESAIADLPADLRWLFEAGALSIEQLAALHDALGVTSVTDLGIELSLGSIRRVPGLNAEVEAHVTAALPTLRAALPRIPLGRAVNLAQPLVDRLMDAGARWALPAGSMRRGQESVGDIELVAPLADPAAAFEEILRLPDVTRTLHRSARRLYVLVERVQVGVRCPEPAEAGAALLTQTGTRDHIDALARLGRARHWTLTPRGLMGDEGARIAGGDEEEIYAALGLPFIPPEIRDGTEAIAAAREGALPSLVSRIDIRGDLHMHTNYSDGHDPIEAMVAQAVALGYEYVAITDHSPNSGATRNLTADSVSRQADEIAALQERYPGITILHGCEVDILPDGRLDFPDAILRRFDLVLASLHERNGHSPGQLLQRYLTAMRHPLVALITHPTNRLIPYRLGYELDYDRLFAAAADTNTLVEIDGAPAHLDLDGGLARRAIAAGATLAIDSDCHRADMLERQMQLGVTTARRGWVEAQHVVNARPLDQLLAFVAAKRGY